MDLDKYDCLRAGNPKGHKKRNEIQPVLTFTKAPVSSSRLRTSSPQQQWSPTLAFRPPIRRPERSTGSFVNAMTAWKDAPFFASLRVPLQDVAHWTIRLFRCGHNRRGHHLSNRLYLSASTQAIYLLIFGFLIINLIKVDNVDNITWPLYIIKDIRLQIADRLSIKALGAELPGELPIKSIDGKNALGVGPLYVRHKFLEVRVVTERKR